MRFRLHWRWSRGAGGRASSPGGELVPKNTFTDVFDNTCDISDFRGQIFCPQTTQQQPKKHNEAGPPEHLHAY